MTSPEGMSKQSAEDLAQVEKVTRALTLTNTVADGVATYRQKLIDGGIGPDAADQMAVRYHDTLMAVIEQGAVAQGAAAVIKSAVGGAGKFPKRGR